MKAASAIGEGEPLDDHDGLPFLSPRAAAPAGGASPTPIPKACENPSSASSSTDSLSR